MVKENKPTEWHVAYKVTTNGKRHVYTGNGNLGPIGEFSLTGTLLQLEKHLNQKALELQRAYGKNAKVSFTTR